MVTKHFCVVPVDLWFSDSSGLTSHSKVEVRLFLSDLGEESASSEMYHAGIKEIISIPASLCLLVIIVAAALFHRWGGDGGYFGSLQAAQLAARPRWSVLCKYKQPLYQREQLPWVALQQGDVKWILDLLCLQQVTYCCAGLSAALEKPFKQDNLSATRHGGALFPPRTQTKGPFDWEYEAIGVGE